MNLIRVSLHAVLFKPLLTLLVTLLLILPVALITTIYLVDFDTETFFRKSTGRVDLILAPAGDQGDIISSCLFYRGHEGDEIPLDESRKLIRNPAVRLAVPVLARDNFQGFRIVGTDNHYSEMFDITLQSGRWCTGGFEAVLGYRVSQMTGLKLGSEFYGSHGWEPGGASHRSHPYKVTGILNKDRGPSDRLIFCSVESVWNLHDPENDSLENHETERSRKQPGDYFPFDFPERQDASITAALISLRIPVLPYQFLKNNQDRSRYWAVSPFLEISRLYDSMRFALIALTWFGISLLALGMLVLLARLYHWVIQKPGDLVLIRALGATKFQLAGMIVLQGLILTDIGTFTGILAAHFARGIILSQGMFSSYGIPGTGILWQELVIYLAVLLLGTLVSLVPALRSNQMNQWIIPPGMV